MVNVTLFLGEVHSPWGQHITCLKCKVKHWAQDAVTPQREGQSLEAHW